MIDDARLVVSIYNSDECTGLSYLVRQGLLDTEYTPEELAAIFEVLQVARWEDV